MIGYVTLGTNDLLRACAFYDTLLAGMGGKRRGCFRDLDGDKLNVFCMPAAKG